MIRQAEEILKESMPFGMLFESVAIYAINAAREELLDDIKAKVVENRYTAHVNCLEDYKQALNHVINIIENTRQAIHP